MLNLEEKTRNEIVQTLQMQVVPAGSGAILMQIAQILSGLKSEDVPMQGIEGAVQKAKSGGPISPIVPKKDA